MLQWGITLFSILFKKMIFEHKRAYYVRILLKEQENMTQNISKFSRVFPFIQSAKEKDKLEIIQKYISLIHDIELNQHILFKILSHIDEEHSWISTLDAYKKEKVLKNFSEWEDNVLLFTSNILSYSASIIDIYAEIFVHLEERPEDAQNLQSLLKDVIEDHQKLSVHVQSIIPVT